MLSRVTDAANDIGGMKIGAWAVSCVTFGGMLGTRLSMHGEPYQHAPK